MNAPDSPSQAPQNPIWRALYAAFLDALFPPRCGGCATWSRAVFCTSCAPLLRPIQAPLCDFCGEPFDPLALPAPICARCRAKPPAFRLARAVFDFDGPARHAIHRLKYRQKSALAPRLAPFFVSAIGQDPFLRAFDPHFLVPVPLHRARLKKRGFNQSFLLATELSRLIGVPTRPLLRRTRNTPPQVGLKGEARTKNVRGAFSTSDQFAPFAGARLLLIDDVFTTGATLSEAAKALRKAGASEVCALTLARLNLAR